DRVNHDAWSSRLQSNRDLSLLQTWPYGEAKSQTGPWVVERALILDDGRELGVVQAFVRKLPLVRVGLVWINRAPFLFENFHRGRRILEVAQRKEVRDKRHS